jgi:DNA polymerase (family 10)
MTKIFSNQEVANLFRETAAVLEVLGENRFRVIAYQNAADAVEHLTTSIYTLWEQDRLGEVSGIGKGMSEHINELFTSGRSKYIDEIKGKVPAGMFGLLNTASIGPKKAYKLAVEFKLETPKSAPLKIIEAGKKNLIQKIPGFGAKSEADMVAALESKLMKAPERLRIDVADKLAVAVIEYLKLSPLVFDVSGMGSLRRRVSTVGDVDVGVATQKPEELLEYIKTFPEAKDFQAAGENMIRLIHINGYHVDIKVVPKSDWGSLLQHFTGSKAHNIHLRQFAIDQGKSLSEYGIKKGDETQKFIDEVNFYRALGLAWIPPELREDRGEIEAAKANKLPELVTVEDIKGDLHTHSDFGWISSHDKGENSFEEMAEGAVELGYKYIGLGDHNPSQKSVKDNEVVGLIKDRSEQIKKVQKKLPEIKLLATLEIDIRPDGSLAIPEEALKYLDYALVSIHSNLNQNKEVQTKRVLKALDYPKVKVLGHPTGRLINSRAGYELEWPQIFAKCRDRNIALEINAYPARLDVDEFVVRMAIENGVNLVIDTDSHAVNQLAYVHYGVDVARRGWAEAKNIVNTWKWKKFSEWLMG